VRLSLYKETSCRVPIQRLKRLFELIAEEEAEPDSKGCVNIILTTDAAIRKLNREFRKADRATDVLSFNIDSNGEPDSVFGEVYISIASATRQAKSYDGTMSEELLRLACHGFLHLFSYDHQTRRDEVKMKKAEEHFLSRAGDK